MVLSIFFFREQLNGHIASTCLRAMVECVVPVCRQRLRREDLPNHLERESEMHVEVLMADRMANSLDNVSY